AAPPGVDLRFDDRQAPAKLVECRGGLVRRLPDDAPRHGDSGVAKEFFCLKFVDFHIEWPCRSARGECVNKSWSIAPSCGSFNAPPTRVSRNAAPTVRRR